MKYLKKKKAEIANQIEKWQVISLKNAESCYVEKKFTK